jgi:hypothetical protein
MEDDLENIGDQVKEVTDDVFQAHGTTARGYDQKYARVDG